MVQVAGNTARQKVRLARQARQEEIPSRHELCRAAGVDVYIILDVTTDVERCFARLQRLEIKSRERHCHPSRLHDSLNIVLEVPSTVDALVTRTPTPVRLDSKAPLLHLMWRPGPLLTKAQAKYAEFFGRKRLPCRSMEAVPLALRAKEIRGRVVRKSQAVSPKAKAKITKAALKKKWTKHVQGLVKEWRNRAGSLKPSSSASGLQPVESERQQRAFVAMARRKLSDRLNFEKTEKTTGLNRPVKPLYTKAKAAAKAKAQGKAKAKAQAKAKAKPQAKAATFEKVWFACAKTAKDSKMRLSASEDKMSAQILVVDEFETSLKTSSASLHCRLHGKTLASTNAFIEEGRVQGQHASFIALSHDLIVFASNEVTRKHKSLIQELQRAKRVKLITDEARMLAVCSDAAVSQARWLGIKSEIAGFAAKLAAAKLPATRVIACTASHFVQHVGTVVS